MSEKPGRVEEFVVSGDSLIAKIKELLHEGNVRRVSLQTEEGNTLIEVPLMVGMAGRLPGRSLPRCGPPLARSQPWLPSSGSLSSGSSSSRATPGGYLQA